MPEMTFTVRWPDGRVTACSSPSLVMWDHLAVDAEYDVAEFAARSAAGLDEASERVRARWGFACTSAAAERDAIAAEAARWPPDAVVRVLTMHPSLPGDA